MAILRVLITLFDLLLRCLGRADLDVDLRFFFEGLPDLFLFNRC